MRIAVTGATGHVGVNLVKSLVDKGFDVTALIHKNPSIFNGLNIDKVNGDLLIPDTLSKFCKDADVVIHLAALISIGSSSFNQVQMTNVVGTKNLVEAAKVIGVRKFIHFSSIHALIHEPLDQPMDENRELAIDSKISYERTKAIAEKWVLEQQSENFDVIVLNPTSIIGPKDPGPSLMGEFICGAYKGTIPGVVPGGYDWVDVRDIVDATIEAINKGRGGERYILSGSWLKIKEFADIFIEVSDKKRLLPVIPLWLATIGVPFLFLFSKLTGTKPLYTKESLSILQSGNQNISSKKAQKELNFNPRPLKETLADTYSWFKENKYF